MVLPGKDDEGNLRDVVKVCDFGIAKITERAVDKKATDSARLSTKGLVVGTPEYMSPEQGRGEPLDLRSDLYSMGVILFQLLTRQVPFDAESAIGIVLKHVTEEPPLPSSIYPNVNPKLEAVCLKALQKKKEDRYQDARAMRADLKAAIDANASSVAIGARAALESRGSDERPMENAATIPIDLRSMAAAEMNPTSSKVTPIGTEALDALPAGVPRRWTGYAIAIALVCAVGFGTFEVVRFYKKQSQKLPESQTQAQAQMPTLPAPTLQPTLPQLPAPQTPVTIVPPPGSTAVIITPVVASARRGAPSASGKSNAPPGTSSSAIAPPASVSAATTTPPVVVENKPASGPFVRVGQPKNITGNVDARTLRNALAGAYAQLNACYVNGIHAGDKAQAYTADMQVKLGTQSSATMGIPDFLTKSGQCVMNTATSALTTITENGTADVPIEFVPGS
jgi:serine/threonine-protein kinase